MNVELDDTMVRELSRYVDRVSEALGNRGRCSSFDLGPPFAAYLAVDGHVEAFPDHDVALLWDQVAGWSAIVETARGDVVVGRLGGEVRPRPDVVARFLAEVLDGEPPAVIVPGTRTADPLLTRLSA
ncbi:DUF6292 family protein [Actinosynnema sp. NPDC050436]|uniref:DUF6292 family protein n=1 Tax=Actinosynnema sp. NPDC050436 TaxID=3155659 RepID=UPI0033D7ADC6